MEKLILKLHLNDLGKRALNAEIKTFYVDATRDEIDPEFVDKLFPKDLVEKIEVVRSFASYADGERLVCIKDGERLLAEVINWNPYDKSLLVKVYEEGEEHFYSFHPDGKEFGHHKNKAILADPVEGELEELEFKLRNRPFHEVLKLLCENNVLHFNLASLELPAWLSIADVEKLRKMLEDKKKDYLFSNEDNF